MNLFKALLDLLFPPSCVFCTGRVGEGTTALLICSLCLAQVPVPEACCFKCAQPLAAGQESCPQCSGLSFAFKSACTVQAYRGAVKRAIHNYKYHGRKEMAKTLGGLMAQQIRRSGWPKMEAIVPVPLHRSRLSERGYDQALLLAQVVAAELRLPLKKALQRKSATPSQTKLVARERWENVSQAFELVAGVPLPARVLLVDDLLTTGATAHFAAQTLLDGGAKEVYLAVVGR
ncbi:MAG: ComF family protein [Dethiobacter sp.]|nr:ComF family protein [Dethiobacter sp.]MCL4462274.1 ComF family protein [Bacillota bacterium]MCL5993855.1 ComF family protein [Bacillota bacterium]